MKASLNEHGELDIDFEELSHRLKKTRVEKGDKQKEKEKRKEADTLSERYDFDIVNNVIEKEPVKRMPPKNWFQKKEETEKEI